MGKKFIITAIILLLIGVSAGIFGLFPVARVNGEFVLYRTYNERANALERFETKNRLVAGSESLTPAEQEEIRKFILQNLIVEHVFWQYVEEHTALSGLKESADAVVAGTPQKTEPKVLPPATQQK